MSNSPSHTSTQTSLAMRSAIAANPVSGFAQSLDHASLRRVEAKGFLFTEGDPISHVYRIETGAIALVRVLADGRRQVMGFAYPGDLIGLGVEDEHAMNAQALKPTRVRCLPVSSVRQSTTNDPTLGFMLYEALARELAATRDLMLTTGHRTAAERLAGFLAAFSRRNERNGKDATILQLPMSRSDIGDFLGLTIETVSRTFTKFKAMGLIELRQGNEVKIIDRVALEKLAAGDERKS